MDGERVYGDSNMTVILQNDRLPCSSGVLESLWNSNSSPSFQGDSVSCSTSMPNFEDVRVGHQIDTKRPFFPPLENEENGNEDYDSCLHQPEKKRRLTADQVQFLERNFEVENKLEPERKELLAKELGLHPRQVAIWFQNRRARFKTKQIEKDYGSVKSSFDKLKDDYECLLKEKERLRNEVQLLKDKLLLREKESTNLEPTDPVINPVIEEHYKKISNASVFFDKQISNASVEASSAKSDVFDSDSPHCTDGNHSNSFLELANSYHGFGAEQSDFSQDNEDELTRSLLPPPFVPKLENYCNWSFQIEPQPSWLWSE